MSNIHVNVEDKANVIIFINIGVVSDKSTNEMFSELLKYEFIKKVSIV